MEGGEGPAGDPMSCSGDEDGRELGEVSPASGVQGDEEEELGESGAPFSGRSVGGGSGSAEKRTPSSSSGTVSGAGRNRGTGTVPASFWKGRTVSSKTTSRDVKMRRVESS
ncbi:unnamed protein product [Linum trigynum]|uniref:Uncharacterized protein n=1 Tax=Linum trigynum TaxID=586398 RepID=A0AAV2D9I6_9ROSI